MVAPVVGIVDRDGDEHVPAALRGADKDAPGLSGVARLDTDAPLHTPEELVVICERPACADGAFCRYDRAERRIPHGFARQSSQIGRGGVVFLAVKAVRIGEVRVPKAQLPRTAVHKLRETGETSAVGNRERSCGVVAGVEHHSVQQVAHGQRLAAPKVHARALDPDGLIRDR